jgi:hypothetical protein
LTVNHAEALVSILSYILSVGDEQFIQ